MQNFEQIDRDGQKEILNSYQGKDLKVVEKDFWVCFFLSKLFQMPDPHPMAFKGGTSLSKGYQLIHRFSEDIDITLDYKTFKNRIELGCDPFDSGTSRSEIRRASNKIKVEVAKYIEEKLKPYFEEVIQALPSDRSFRVETTGTEELRIYYDSVLGGSSSDYIEEAVLLEFGGRNLIEPQDEIKIKPFLSELQLEGVGFVTASVQILDPLRTFWEKATLVHDFSNKTDRTENLPKTERMSRHWYDLYMMLSANFDSKALEEEAIDLLRDVVKIKDVFYRASDSNYQNCLNGNFRMVPSSKFLEKLEKDYKEMGEAKMFEGEPPEFQTVISSIQSFESKLNQYLRT